MAVIKFTDLTEHLVPPVASDVLVTAKEDVSNGGLLASMVTLHHTTATVTTSNVTAAVGEFYDLTLAGMTADRSFILPDTAKVGERIAWFTNDGDATYVLKLATAAAGSLFEGVDISAGSARYRYFIAGESGHVVCVKAGGAGDTDWRFVPGGDGRIAQSCMLRLLTTTTDTPVTTATWIKVVSSSTNYTEVWDNANLGDVTNDEIDVRRAGIYFVVGSVDLPGLADRARVVHRLDLDGARVICNWDAATSSSAAAAFVSGSAGFVDVTAAAGGSISQQIWQSGANSNINGGADGSHNKTHLQVQELL